MANRKRDVCPECDVHCNQVRVPGDYAGNPFLRPYRCTRCGKTHALCDIKCSTAAERAEAYERKKAYHRKWYAEHAQHCRDYTRMYLRRDENGERQNRNQRKRYRDDPEFRARRNDQSARWAHEHPEERKATCRRYYEVHKYEILAKQKRYMLRKAREGRCNSTT